MDTLTKLKLIWFQFTYHVTIAWRELRVTLKRKGKPLDPTRIGFTLVEEGIVELINYGKRRFRIFEYRDAEHVWRLRLQDHVRGSYEITPYFGRRDGMATLIGDEQRDFETVLGYLGFPPLDPASRYNKVKNII